MTTHYAAVNKDGIIIGTRSSASRHVDGEGRFGPYTHAVVRTERKTMLASGESTESRGVISWHGGLANAQAGLKQAHVGRSWTWTIGPVEEHHTTTYVTAELVPVVIMARKPKVGQQAFAAAEVK